MKPGIAAMFLWLLVSLLTVAGTEAQPPSGGSNWYDVRAYGADPAGGVVSTMAIQRAVDSCHASGGGTVYFGAGRYLSGRLVLRSGVSVWLDAGAVLLASRNPAHYPRAAADYQNTETCLLYADSVSNVSILGKGIIDGQARHVWDTLREVDNFIATETARARSAGVPMQRFYAVDPKVRLVFINNATNITIRDVQLINSPDWGLHIGNASDVVIDGVTIRSSLERGVNSDGIDIDGCRNVRISNCNISTGDDAICLKSTLRFGRYGNCENIVINNCTLESTSAALKIGTESHGDFRGIIFSNCVVRNSNRGISIIVRDGGTVSDVLFTDLIIDCNRKHFNWWGDGDPIRFILLQRTPASRIGKIRNVTVRNVQASGAGTSLLQGHPTQPLENIRFDNVTLSMEPERRPDLRATDIIQVDGVAGLTLNEVHLARADTVQPTWRSALRVSKTERLLVHGLFVGSRFDTHAPVVLQSVNYAIIDRLFAPQPRSALFQFTRSQQVQVGTVYRWPPAPATGAPSGVRRAASHFQ